MVLLFAETFRRILEILLVPYYYNEVIWVIAPLLFVLIMIQMYFGRYKTEQLGWNTAFGNTVSLMWVTVIMFKFLHDNHGGLGLAWFTVRGDVIIITAMGLLTFTLAILDFYHVLPKRLAFLISSTLPLNGMAFLTVLIVVGNIPFDRATLQAVIVLFMFFIALFHLYREMITPAKNIKPTLKKHEDKKKKEIKKTERKAKKKYLDTLIKLKYIFKLPFWKRKRTYSKFHSSEVDKVKKLKQERKERKKKEAERKRKKEKKKQKESKKKSNK